MDVRQPQLASREQEAVLRGLAHAAARPHGCFLEVGSWCGDSSVLLAQVVREYGGRLFCIDWWKGNAGTDLADLAAREDVFSRFWQRICREGLEDVVVPVRGRSDVVAPFLRPDAFRLVFLDADHRFQGIARDIEAYAPLVSRDAGILCGHDCEGWLADYDAAFLEAGKDRDCHESVHCGVVCAVGAAFPQYTLNHSVWSVRPAGAGWEPTNLTIPGIPNRSQAPPPPIGVTAAHNLLRCGKRVYAIPHGWADFDITDEAQRNQPGILSALTRREAEQLARQAEERARLEALRREALLAATPILLEEGYLGFNIVKYNRRFYAMDQELGPVDLPHLSAADVADLNCQSRLLVADSHRAARLQVAKARLTAAR